MSGSSGFQQSASPQPVMGVAGDFASQNPYFTFDPAKCILCSRCVRACEEVQGTFALTIQGRGFASVVSAGDKPFIESEWAHAGGLSYEI